MVRLPASEGIHSGIAGEEFHQHKCYPRSVLSSELIIENPRDPNACSLMEETHNIHLCLQATIRTFVNSLFNGNLDDPDGL